VALAWALFVGLPALWIVFALRRHSGDPVSAEAGPGLLGSLVMFVTGGFFIGAGVAAYLVLIASDCFTFDFQRPVLSRVKKKLFLADIVVLTAVAVGFGLILAPFAAPVLVAWGISPPVASMAPVVGLVMVLHILRVFVLAWAPLEKRLISKRLAALGISAAQLQMARLVGVSDPARSIFKRSYMVEDDIGALWVGPEQLIYWGDDQQFSISREQLTQIERKACGRSSTMLSGLTHVILHVAQSDGSERQIRLHTEGQCTMGGKRRAMDALEQSIARWHTSPALVALV
jgi:hypothetical protein